MRELEFLPAWYPQTRARRRMVVLQTQLTLVLAGGLALWGMLVHRNTMAAAALLIDANGQVHQTQNQLHVLEDQLSVKKQLLLQRQIVGKLGLPVEMSRMLATLDDRMPRQMSLTDVSLMTEEQARAVINTPAAALAAGRGDTVDRRLRVRLQGVAPTDTDVANFLAGLTNVPFFDSVAMNYSRDKLDDGHLMREFEITFSVDLNQQWSGL